MTGLASDLRDLETSDCAYVLRFEGVPTAFTNSPHLADGTWSTDSTTVLEALHPPKFSMGINPRTGAFTTSTTTFMLAETFDDDLVDLFAAVRTDVVPLDNTIEAGKSAGPAAVYSKHVGTELFGSAGERMQFPALPGYDIGYRHVGKFDAASNDQAWVPVTAKPKVWAGRRCALLRVFHNRISVGEVYGGANWTSDQNSDVVWWGTCLDIGRVRGKGWKIDCAGPESWLQKNVGVGTWTHPVHCEPITEFLEGEDFIGAYTVRQGISVTNQYEESYGEDKFTTQCASASLSDIQSAMNTAIDNAATTLTGTDGEYTDEGQGKVDFDTNLHTVGIQVDNPQAGGRAGVLRVMAHKKVWAKLGYVFEREDNQAWGQNKTDFEDPLYVTAWRLGEEVGFPDGSNHLSDLVDVEASGYWQAEFSTNAPWNFAPHPNADLNKRDNDGAFRYYSPRFPGGVDTISPDGKQEIVLGHDVLYLEGQHFRAPMSAVDDETAGYSIGGGVGVVDRQGLFLIWGPRRMADDKDEEVFTEAQVFVGSWKDDGGTIALDSNSRPRMVIEKFLDPRLFGLERDKLDSEWGILGNPTDPADAVNVVPLNHFGYTTGNDADRAWKVILTMLLSTGTSTGHTSFASDDADEVDPGDNDPDDAIETIDYETFPYGLHIPQTRVAPEREWKEEFGKLPPGIQRCKLAYLHPAPGNEIINRVKNPLGLCWHLRGGKYGVFSPWETINPGDVEVVVTSETYSTDLDRPESAIPKQDLRVYGPIDTVEVRSSWNPLEDKTSFEDTYRATDDGARYRVQNADYRVDAHGLHNHVATNWRPDFYDHWKRGFEWWAKRHFMIRGQKLQRKEAQDCWPGARVRYSDNWVVNPAGTSYGVTNFGGFVTALSYDCDLEEGSVDMLIQEDGAFGFHFYAPMARVFHYDTTNFVLYCYDDMYQTGRTNSGSTGNTDVRWFVEPSWSSQGGNMDVELFQYDGNTWTGGIYGTVSTVSDTEGSATITLTGALTGGTFYYDKDTIVVPREYANQGAAWVKALFAGIANQSGEVNGSTANSVKFNGL